MHGEEGERAGGYARACVRNATAWSLLTSLYSLCHAGCVQAMHMFRLTGTVYTFGFLLMTLKYFFSGPPDKSNRARQRARLVHAYMVTLFALLAPVLVSEPQLSCCTSAWGC